MNDGLNVGLFWRYQGQHPRLLSREIRRELWFACRSRRWATLTYGKAYSLGQLLQDIVNPCDQFRPTFNEIIRAAATWHVNTPRHGKDLPALLQGMARRMQRATLVRRFDHQDAQGETTDNPVTARKIPAIGFSIVRKLRHHRPLGADGVIQAAMFWGIDHVDPAPQHGDSPSACLQRAPVCQTIDPTGQTADHSKAILGQLCTQTLGSQLAIGTRFA